MKKAILFVGVILAASAIWYLFIKSHDYQVTFNVKTIPGTVNQVIKTWGSSIDDSKILHQTNDISKLTQQFKFSDSIHVYDWKISPIHDSLSKVIVYAKDENFSFQNKLKIPFSDTDFEKRTKNNLTAFGKALNEHLKKFKVEIIGESSTTTNFCACTALKTSQFGKAKGMMRDFPFLSSFLLKNNVELNGRPFLEVTKWSKEKDSLNFKFCFPVIQTELLPNHPELEFRNYYGRPAIKAVYNGNYITSDRAWYALIDYAKKNNIEVAELPVEVFHNNPNMGGNEPNWKAEIFMPLKVDTNE